MELTFLGKSGECWFFQPKPEQIKNEKQLKATGKNQMEREIKSILRSLANRAIMMTDMAVIEWDEEEISKKKNCINRLNNVLELLERLESEYCAIIGTYETRKANRYDEPFNEE